MSFRKQSLLQKSCWFGSGLHETIQGSGRKSTRSYKQHTGFLTLGSCYFTRRMTHTLQRGICPKFSSLFPLKCILFLRCDTRKRKDFLVILWDSRRAWVSRRKAQEEESVYNGSSLESEILLCLSYSAVGLWSYLNAAEKKLCTLHILVHIQLNSCESS